MNPYTHYLYNYPSYLSQELYALTDASLYGQPLILLILSDTCHRSLLFSTLN